MRQATNIGDAIWRAFLRWSQLDFGDKILTSSERWSVVAATVPVVLRTRYHRPARLWLLTRSPAWVVTRRLEARSHSWYRVPDAAAAEHVRLRFDIWPIEVGDHMRVQAGRLTAIRVRHPDLFGDHLRAAERRTRAGSRQVSAGKGRAYGPRFAVKPELEREEEPRIRRKPAKIRR